MIKIERTEPQSKSWANWSNKCATKTAEAIQQFNAGNRPVFSSLYKKQKKVLAQLSKEKCAYCEKKILSSQHGEIDHYRPKSGLSEEDWTTVHLLQNGRSGPHPGYFWLAYDPNNLIFCCISCNQVGERREWGKGTRFPVMGFRAEVPGEERNEDPKLLNPYFDDPDEHITVDATGLYSAVNDSEKGRASINILGLNQRGLHSERATKYRDVRDKLGLILARSGAVGTEETLRTLREFVEDGQEFANVVRKAARDAAQEVLRALEQAGVV